MCLLRKTVRGAFFCTRGEIHHGPPHPACCNCHVVIEKGERRKEKGERRKEEGAGIPGSIVATFNVVVCRETPIVYRRPRYRGAFMCRDQSSVRSDEKEKRDLAEKLDLMLHVCFFYLFFYFQVIRGGGGLFSCVKEIVLWVFSSSKCTWSSQSDEGSGETRHNDHMAVPGAVRECVCVCVCLCVCVCVCV